MATLSTTYLGLKLSNPVVASSSPLSESVESVQQLEEAGVAAVIMPSLFEEQVIHESLELDHYLFYGTESSAEVNSFYPREGQYTLRGDAYIENLARLKKAVRIPVICSLNGVSSKGWTKYAQKIEAAGADALELNLYYLATEPELTSSRLEDNYVTLVGNIRKSINIPIAVKLSPFFTALPNISRRLVDAGANGLVLFNRFYQPDLDLENLEIVPNLTLSTSTEMRLPLRWIAILYGRISADLALTTGVHTAEDVVKGIMAGASVTMLASAMLKNGIGHAREILDGVENWMKAHEYESIEQLKGILSQRSTNGTAALERANYMKVLSSMKSLP